jgi:hypothetical protein
LSGKPRSAGSANGIEIVTGILHVIADYEIGFGYEDGYEQEKARRTEGRAS